MSWDAIGAVGEFVSAIAVLITLVFVVVQLKHLSEQTRQNTLAIKFSSYGSHADTLSQFQQNLAMDTGLGDVVFECQRAEAYGHDSIDEKVWWRYSLAMRAVFVMHEDLYYQHEQGMIDHSYWDHRCQFLAQLIASNPVARGWWNREASATVYVPGFIEAIESANITIAGDYLDGRNG